MRQSLLITATVLTLATTSFAQNNAAGATAPKLLPGTRVNVLSTIEGHATNASNVPLQDALIRLRDARYGRIVDTEKTDKQGAFTFRNVDPGTYVVEIVNPGNSTVIASSQILYVSTGDAVTALVKLPYAAVLGPSTASTVSSAAQAVLAAAAASSTIAETLVGAPATVTKASNGR
jgi:Carboxypeptidase regulatory-like domain